MSTATPSRPLVRGRRRARRLASRFVGSLATPLVNSDYLDMFVPLRHGGELRAKVVAVHSETPDAVTLVLRPGRDWAGHTPGQHLRVGVEVDGVRLWRSYSITSAPMRGGASTARLAITVKAVPAGAVSTHLTQRTKVGDLLFLDQADGDFTAPPAPPAPPALDALDRLDAATGVLYVAGGSGITPLLGMLRGGTLSGDVVVVYSSSTPEHAICGDELRSLARAGRITLFEWHTATEVRLSADDLLQLVPDAHSRQTLACGPAGLVQMVEQAWDAAGCTERLRTETFHTPVIASAGGGTAHFEGGDVTVTTAPGESLLNAGEAAGLRLPSGCRQGICFRCVRPLISGAVMDLRTGEITHAEEGDGVSIQTCISTSAGSCRIDG